MYSLSIIFSFCSVWCLLAVSERIELEKKGVTLLLSKNKKVAKIVAFLFFIAATGLLIDILGTASGIFSSLSLWMIAASFIVLFTPFKNFKTYYLFIITISIVAIELLNIIV